MIGATGRAVDAMAWGMTDYSCSRCGTARRIADSVPGTPMHPCSAVAGMTVPLAAGDGSSKVEMVAREDYVGTEDVQRDADGRVWAAVRVTTDDAEHVAVYAPTAHAALT